MAATEQRIEELEAELAALKEDIDQPELSRREFVKSGIATVGLGSLSSGSLEPIELPPGYNTDATGFIAAPRYYGPLSARPEPGDDFFYRKTGVFVYKTDGSGGGDGKEYWISVDQGSVISGWNELPMPIPTNQLDEVETQQAISFFNHTFARPESPDTKNWLFTPADVTKVASEVELASTTVLETTQRGNYPPGGEATPGVAFRLTGTPTAGEGFAGYATTDDGLIAGEDTTDSYVEIRKGGTVKKIHRPDWNGFVPDSRVWVDTRPIITRMPHLFYGGGDLGIEALLHGDDGSRLRRLHTFTADSIDATFSDGATIEQPNLPVRFESASLTGGNVRANACHYQFELSQGETRINGEHFTGVSAGTTGWTPLIAWRKRANWDMVNVKPLKIKVVAAGADAKLDLQLGATVSGGTWNLPENTSSSETALEFNTGVSLDATGERRWVGYVAAGQGNQAGEAEADGLDFNLATDRVVVLAAQGVGGTATLAGAVGEEEYF